MIGLLMVLAGFSLARAGEVPPAKPVPVIKKEKGKPMTAVWPSGNRAEVMLNRNAPIDVPVDYQITETSCGQTVGQTFTLHFQLKADRLVLVWTQHSDPAKVGKPVTLGGTQMIPAAEQEVLTNTSQFNYPDLSTGMAKDKFVFQDVSWIPGLEDGKLKPFTIDTWFEENMVVNSQTGVNENRIVGTVSGVHVAPDGTIDSMDSGEEVGGNFGGALLLVGDVVTWIITTPKGLCQISSKPNLGPAKVQVGEYLQKLPNTFEPYNWGSDGHSRFSDDDKNSLIQNKYVEIADE